MTTTLITINFQQFPIFHLKFCYNWIHLYIIAWFSYITYISRAIPLSIFISDLTFIDIQIYIYVQVYI